MWHSSGRMGWGASSTEKCQEGWEQVLHTFRAAAHMGRGRKLRRARAPGSHWSSAVCQPCCTQTERRDGDRGWREAGTGQWQQDLSSLFWKGHRSLGTNRLLKWSCLSVTRNLLMPTQWNWSRRRGTCHFGTPIRDMDGAVLQPASEPFGILSPSS